MQIEELLGTKKFIQDTMQHFALTRCTGKIVRDTTEWLIRMNRVRFSAEYDETYDYLGNEIKVHIDMEDPTLVLSYKWNTTTVRIENIYRIGEYIGKWLQENVTSSSLPWSYLKEKFHGTENIN